MWAMTKRLSALALAGAIVGALLASIISPPIFNSGLAADYMCNCLTRTRLVTSNLLWSQFIGAICGALLFLVVGIIVIRARHNKNAQPVATPPAAPTGGQP